MDVLPNYAAPHRSAVGGSTFVVANGGAKALADPESRAAFTRRVESALAASVIFTDPGMDIGARIKQAIAEGATMVVASGGDGTVSAAVAALADTDVTLGVLPLGTLNHFAKDLGMPLELEDALAVLRAGHVAVIDVGVVNDRCFVNNSGLGLYPDIVAQRQAREHAGASKWPAAFAASVAALRHYRLLGIRVVVDGKTLLRRTPVVFVGNNEYVMETPLDPRRATLNGGQLCLYIPHAHGRLKLIWFTLRALFGYLRPDHEFDMIMADSFTIESRHATLRVSLDGEVVMMNTPLEYATKPGALRVVVPVEGA